MRGAPVEPPPRKARLLRTWLLRSHMPDLLVMAIPPAVCRPVRDLVAGHCPAWPLHSRFAHRCLPLRPACGFSLGSGCLRPAFLRVPLGARSRCLLCCLPVLAPSPSFCSSAFRGPPHFAGSCSSGSSCTTDLSSRCRVRIAQRLTTLIKKVRVCVCVFVCVCVCL